MYIRSSIEDEVIYVCVRGPLPGIWRGIHMVRGCMRWLEDDGPGVGIRCGRLAIQGQWTAAPLVLVRCVTMVSLSWSIIHGGGRGGHLGIMGSGRA